MRDSALLQERRVDRINARGFANLHNAWKTSNEFEEILIVDRTVSTAGKSAGEGSL